MNLLLAATGAYQQQTEGIPPAGWFFMGVLAVGFIWAIYFVATLNQEHVHERWFNNEFYTTKKAARICGRVSERVADGHWINVIKSLWVMNTKENARYFILRIDELNTPLITPIKIEKAKEFIVETVDDSTAKRLIHDWLSEEHVSLSATTVHHDNH